MRTAPAPPCVDSALPPDDDQSTAGLYCGDCPGWREDSVTCLCRIPACPSPTVPGAAVATCPRRLIHPCDYARLWPSVRQTVLEREPYAVVYRIVAPGHGERWMSERGRGVYDACGALTAVEAVLCDVTAQRRAFEALVGDVHGRRDATADRGRIVLRLDRSGRVQFASASFHELLGYRPGRLVGLRAADIVAVPEGVSADERLGIWELSCDGDWLGDDVEVDCVAADGSLRRVAWRVRPLRDHVGRTRGAVCHGELVHSSNASGDAGAERRRQLSSVMHELLMEEQRERRYVAEALRDRVGQSLTGLQLRLRALGERLPGEEARAEAQEMASLLEETICAARSLTSRLNAFVLHNLGLGAAIQGLLDDLNEVGIRVALECEEAADAVGGDLGTIAYGTVEELLSNVELHSQADRARVACAVRDGAVILTVTDNGVGFDGARAAYRNHRERRAGLRAISERLGLLGGSLDIDTAVGVGTRALVRLPLDGRPAGRAGLQVNT